MRSRAAGLLAVLSLAGCAGASNAPGPTDAAQEPGMSGRWILTAPNAPSCGVTFAAPAGAQQGVVDPEGGCPANFFTGRRWALADGILTVTDEARRPLARLTFAGDRFAGQSSDGVPLTLIREPQAQ
jgi:hypothetical protein